MKRTASFVFGTAATLITGAWAGGLPQQATIEAVNGQGVLAGTGSVHGRALEVELADAALAFELHSHASVEARNGPAATPSSEGVLEPGGGSAN